MFRDYSVWDKTVCKKVRAFKKEKGYYPTAMLARRSTYHKIDKASKKYNDGCELECQDPWGNCWQESWDDFEGGLSCLGVRGEFCVTFYVDTEKKLPKDVFKLIFDEDPTFDGEDDPADLLPLSDTA